MKLMKYTNESGTSSEEVGALYMDGYDFGDRLLEGMCFKITVGPDGKPEITSEDWYPGLDQAHWTALALECIEDDPNLSANPSMDDGLGWIDWEV